MKKKFEVLRLRNIAILNDMEEEKIVQVKTYEDYLKEKAAMDCQMQLLLRLKEKVDGVSERLASERSVFVAKQCNLQEFLSELQLNQGRMLGLGWKMRQGKAKAELGEGGNGTIKPDHNNA
ncbi:hypothetical protein POTOM_031605 [Populus tomentosa]|uniref:Uncharacterized protein n=1 Tax=Populus tomentosa TaxID=118781 RepID=A0A8X7ZAU7_POPTO|nr:hypothetical protein POTOM_031605 [Populus tomentosa]